MPILSGEALLPHRIFSDQFAVSLAISQKGEKWGDLERHFFARGQGSNGVRIHHCDLIAPWIQLDPAADRKRCYLIEPPLFQSWHRVKDRRHPDIVAMCHSVAELWSDQIGEHERTLA